MESTQGITNANAPTQNAPAEGSGNYSMSLPLDLNKDDLEEFLASLEDFQPTVTFNLSYQIQRFQTS